MGGRRTWFVIRVGHELLAVKERRVDADRLRETCGPMATVVPVVPLGDLPEPWNTEPRHQQPSQADYEDGHR